MTRPPEVFEQKPFAAAVRSVVRTPFGYTSAVLSRNGSVTTPLVIAFGLSVEGDAANGSSDVSVMIGLVVVTILKKLSTART